MFGNYKAVKAVMDSKKGIEDQEEGINFTRVNNEFREQKNKLLKGEKVNIDTEANVSVLEKMKKVKNKIVSAKEGYIKVDEFGKEVFKEGRGV